MTGLNRGRGRGGLPGLFIDPEALDIDKDTRQLRWPIRAVPERESLWAGQNNEKILLRTPSMVAEGKALLLYCDGSMSYIADLGADPSSGLRVLPTPIALRTRLTHFGHPLEHRIDSWTTKGSLTLTLSGETLAAGSFMAGDEHPDAPPTSPVAQSWIMQLDNEIAALDRRLAALAPYRLDQERFGSSAFLHRRTSLEEDGHLGQLVVPLGRQVLVELKRAFQLAVLIVQGRLRGDMDEDSYGCLELHPPGIENDEPKVWFNGPYRLERTGATDLVAEIMGREALALAGQCFASAMFSPQSGAMRSQTVLMKASFTRELPSAHDLLTMHAELAELRRGFASRVTLPPEASRPKARHDHWLAGVTL